MNSSPYDSDLDETVPLSDLVLLQMMGEIDTYMDELLNNGDPEHIVREAEEAAAVDDVFDEIVRKTVEAQFEDKYTFVRELAQNAKDAYPRDRTDRPVTFTLAHGDAASVLTARDNGGGMAPDELVQELLIPYRSGKHLDPATIGEHGIGWYSVLEPADEVTVTTGADGVTTEATIRETPDGWVADITTEAGEFDGTAIDVATTPRNFEHGEIMEELRQHVGYVNPDTATITLDGQTVNTLPDTYEWGASESVDAKHGRETLDLYYRKTDTHESTIPLTQDGLHVTEENAFYLLEGDDQDRRILNDIMNDLVDNGYEFWIDIPDTAGLTKGRNEIVAGDRDAVYDAITPAFEDFVIERLLEDDGYVKEVDTKAAQWVNELLEEEYLNKRLTDQLSADPLQMAKTGAKAGAGLALLPIVLPYAIATDDMIQENVKDTASTPGNLVDDPEDTLESLWKDFKTWRYTRRFSGFSERVMEKNCIDAVYVDSTPRETQASIRDMIDAYIEGELYTADELFFTGTAAEVTPIRAVDDIEIGEGTRGPVTEELQSAFFRLVEGRTENHEEWFRYV